MKNLIFLGIVILIAVVILGSVYIENYNWLSRYNAGTLNGRNIYSQRGATMVMGSLEKIFKSCKDGVEKPRFGSDDQGWWIHCGPKAIVFIWQRAGNSGPSLEFDEFSLDYKFLDNH